MCIFSSYLSICLSIHLLSILSYSLTIRNFAGNAHSMDSSLITVPCFSVELEEAEFPDDGIALQSWSMKAVLDPTHEYYMPLCAVFMEPPIWSSGP